MSKRVIVYGGKGALGSACIAAFKNEKWGKYVLEQLRTILNGDKLDAIFCVAGGWAGGNAASKDFAKNCELMWKQSVVSSVIASQAACELLKEGGLISFTGASAATEPTPGMIGYGMAKASVHHLTKSLAASSGGLPTNATAVSILPETLDTPMNRKWMPNADKSTWTPLDFVSNLFIEWTRDVQKPASGSLVKLITRDGVTQLQIS